MLACLLSLIICTSCYLNLMVTCTCIIEYMSSTCLVQVQVYLTLSWKNNVYVVTANYLQVLWSPAFIFTFTCILSFRLSLSPSPLSLLSRFTFICGVHNSRSSCCHHCSVHNYCYHHLLLLCVQEERKY